MGGSGGAAGDGGAVATGGSATGGAHVGGSAGSSDGGAAGGGGAGGGGTFSCLTEGERRCANDGENDFIEECVGGEWTPQAVCRLGVSCDSARCTECPTEGLKSEARLAQCVDGSWVPCVGGDGLNVSFEELCTEVLVFRWEDGRWTEVRIAAISTP